LRYVYGTVSDKVRLGYVTLRLRESSDKVRLGYVTLRYVYGKVLIRLG